MRVLDRYIIREFLKIFAICVMGFLLVFVLVEATERIKDYAKYNPSSWVMLTYFLVKMPAYLFFVIPLGILMGGMLSLLTMARNSEIIAMQANGVDALAIARPVLLIGLVGSVGMFVLNETMIPWANRTSELMLNEIRGVRDLIRKDQIWIRSPRSITHIGKCGEGAKTLEHVTIVSWDEEYRFTERLYADKAVWRGNHWVFYGVNRTARVPAGRFVVQMIPSRVGPLGRTPADFGRVEQLAKEMNLTQLSQYLRTLEEEGHLPTRHLVDWHTKLAFPMVCLIMAGLSVPFAIKVSPRGGGVSIGLALSVLVAFGYWVVNTTFVAMGHGGFVPPIMAAWGANTIFGLLATTLLLQAGT
ncbi:MAG: LPS export ABC transporter permease LptG [Thermodesulfobacteriota bacterium]